MIAVNDLIQQCYQALNITGLDESTEGDASLVAKQELNYLISTLNSQGFLSLTQKSVEVGPNKIYFFKKLAEGEEAGNNVIDMDPPEKIAGVMRRIGVRFVPLHPMDIQQIMTRNRASLPTSWNYSRDIETYETEFGEESKREVGILELDGTPHDKIKIFYNAPLPNYELEDTIYLPALYNELLFTGLKCRLAKRANLNTEKKAECETDFTAAKTLIKRSAITQRMIREEPTGGSYRDNYFNGYAPTGW